MSREAFVALCATHRIPDLHVQAYLRGLYTPEEWAVIWTRYARD
jgi:hypothetical protein